MTSMVLYINSSEYITGHHNTEYYKVQKIYKEREQLDILFSSNHNIHKSLYGLYFWASDSLIDRL